MLWVYGPVAEHPDLGPVWETVPATGEPMAFLDGEKGVSFDRKGGPVFHPDAWLRPVRMDAFEGKRPPRVVTTVPLTRGWLQAIADNHPRQVYLELPDKRDRATPRLTGDELRRRLDKELCIPVQEDYECYASWLWFPGRSLSATAHWWVHEAPPVLIGEVFAPADPAAHDTYWALEKDRSLPWVFADGDWNTYMVLPARFEANLVPRFAQGTFDISERPPVKSRRVRKDGYVFKPVRSEERLRAMWRTSEQLALSCDPESFLQELGRALRRRIDPVPVIHA